MDKILSVLTPEEYIYLSLRALYSGYGYKKYRMSKFEEYDLYAKNKDFLVSESAITFTDTDGKLLALKPDVTLSIIKNSKDISGALKVYYNENVYRISKGTKTFKEIMQSGLECIGNVDLNTITEVLSLASKSLGVISKNNVLTVSHLGIIAEVLNAIGLSDSEKVNFIKLLGQKNMPEIKNLLNLANLSEGKKEVAFKLVSVYGAPSKTFDLINAFNVSEKAKEYICELKTVVEALVKEGANVIIDFSVVNDMNYYNGISFKGFIEGVPTGVISGGQYDNLLKKMGKPYKAIGFAVYLDEVSRIKGE
ncbi:MAG: ATP phosphoribosyltransferase regulatory subunit [Clostridia bacterium]|nr:ATP phosphoribosyltransferase regulatory subunit [Clostridia bacterium]